jgi:hypothetical protein
MSYNILFLNELADRPGLGSIELSSSDSHEQTVAISIITKITPARLMAKFQTISERVSYTVRDRMEFISKSSSQSCRRCECTFGCAPATSRRLSRKPIFGDTP